MGDQISLTDSILDSIKHKLNLMPDYTAFDDDIIISINSCFARLNQLGIGTDSVFKITGSNEVWSSFITDDRINSVIDYIYLKTQLLFDNTMNSGIINLKQEQIKEFEWTLKVVSEEIRAEKVGD